MIERGEKPEEYRDESPYWRRRLIECYGAFGWCNVRGFDGRLCGGCSVGPIFKHFDAVCFSYGYTRRRMMFECKRITMGQGRPEWGAPDHETFIVKLGDKLIKNSIEMKREILFRGKEIKTGKWIEGDLLRMGGHSFIFPDPAPKGFNQYEVDPETVGQFTGVKDKIGTRIFEGDVLGVGGRIIGWVQGGVRGYCYDVVYVNHPKGEERYSLYATATYDYRDRLGVVGNIYDNPEMLKTK